MATKIQSGNSTAGLANVDSAYQLLVVTEKDVTNNPENVGGIKIFSENDDGKVTGTPYLASPETDDDYRLRVAQDALLDTETINYVAQNTGKHTYANTTMAIAWSAAGLITNSGNITTTTTGVTFGTYAFFPFIGSTSLYCELEGSFTAQPTTNTIIDFGMFLRGAATAYAPADGAYFRLTSAGLQGVINSNGSETNTGVFPTSSSDSTPFVYQNNHKYQFIISITERDVEFWIDNQLMGSIETPTGQGQPFMSAALPFSIRHAIVGGAAGSALSFTLNDYTISLAGSQVSEELGTIGNRMYGSYQGLSGGTMGSLASLANNANPVAAVPTNTTSTVLTALGGQGWETDTLAVNTDGIIMSYQNPAGTANVQGRRMRVNGVKIDSYIQTTLTGGGYNAQFALCFGHTAVSLATAEGAAAKAPRKIALGSYSVAANAAALTQLTTIERRLDNPIYVNPAEFIAIAKKKVGTAPSAGVIAYVISLDYSWE
jgi:hypothetical protein